MIKLRDYQQAAVDAAITWMKKSTEPSVIEAATGAGKSLIVANVALWINKNTGKKILCLAPSKELTEQNHEKYLSYGEKASIYSASISKSLRWPVVFGTPITVLNSIKRFTDGSFGAVIIDECHGVTPTILSIVEAMQKANDKTRILGLSATPYRNKQGYIYRYDETGQPVSEGVNGYFHSLIYRITANELIALGYLTPPFLDPDKKPAYDTSSIKNFTEKEIEQAFEGKGRLTASIIEDIVKHSADRQGVMVFASTVKHAYECLESLPAGSHIVTGETNKAEREKIIKAFKARKFKYLVSVGTLTTGFDAPHVDVIAVLRATESPGLFQQIIGRGCRLCEGKENFLVLDYAGNIDRHQLEADLFSPLVKLNEKKEGVTIPAVCQSCGCVNQFKARENKHQLGINEFGNFVDLLGSEIMIDGKPYPAHYGRRCFGFKMVFGQSVRCEHRWSCKECEACKHENDIAARYCEKCKAELVDPNEKLSHDFRRVKRDIYAVSTDKVLWFDVEKHESKSGNICLKAKYKTEYAYFYAWYFPDSSSQRARKLYEDFSAACFQGRICPDVDTFIAYKKNIAPPITITYKKNSDDQFYSVFAHNRHIEELN